MSAEKSKSWYERNKAKVLKRKKEAYWSNREKYLKLTAEWQSKNKDRVAANSRKYRKNNPDKRKQTCRAYVASLSEDEKRQYKLVKRYGITVEEYRRLLKEQDNKCSICSKELGEKLVIDHCHSTGDVRGLLCRSCNGGIGLLTDRHEVVHSAEVYLKRHQCRLNPNILLCHGPITTSMMGILTQKE